ncbi:MAG: hypothetical protein AAGA96_19430 [Verrucomicrobiota bacterium]
MRSTPNPYGGVFLSSLATASSKKLASLTAASILVISTGWSQTRLVSDVDRRAGPRATFQKPIAFEVNDHTVLFEGILFSGGQYLFDDLLVGDLIPDSGEDQWGHFYGGLFDVRIFRRTPQSWAYGVNGRLDVAGFGTDVDVDGRFDVFIRNYLGQLSYGDFDDRNMIALSPRNTLSGEANLFYDGFFAPSDRRAFRYRSRFSSFLVDAAIDEDGRNYNAGFLFRSPSRTRKDSWSMHYNGGDFMDRYDRHGITAAYQISIGSVDVIVNGAWDNFDPNGRFASFDRYAGSVGVSWKRGATTISAGALVAETNGGPLETGYTAGLRYDMARGFSFNAGYLYLDAESLGTDGLPVAAGDFSGFRTSVSYRY